MKAAKHTLESIVDSQLCIGCGACAYICPQEKVTLENIWTEGIRPKRTDNNCENCTQCVEVCPGVEVDFNNPGSSPLNKKWGPITGIWEGHASDSEIRFKGSSGGALTALSMYCIEKLGWEGVLHTGQDDETPILNKTRLSRSREELMKTVGSRYSPASTCDSLELVENASSPCAIVGKPAEIAAVSKAAKLKPELAANVGLTLSFFCAETPPTLATEKLLDRYKVPYKSLDSLRYRGHGWPGYLATRKKGENTVSEHLIYHDSWAFLQSFRPWSTRLWPDGSGELADISCGDPWYEKPDGKNPGFSLIVTRTERGKKIVEDAIEADYLNAKVAESWKLEKSQEGLLQKKGAIWGRQLALKLLGKPTTRYKSAHLFHCWKTLSFNEKLKSTIGTFRRVIAGKYRR